MENYYELLGVSPRADEATIVAAIARKAQELLARKQSPDPEFRLGAEQLEQGLPEARRFLLDPAQRASYDATLGLDAAPPAKPVPPPFAQPSARSERVEDLDISELFDEFERSTPPIPEPPPPPPAPEPAPPYPYDEALTFEAVPPEADDAEPAATPSENSQFSKYYAMFSPEALGTNAAGAQSLPPGHEYCSTCHGVMACDAPQCPNCGELRVAVTYAKAFTDATKDGKGDAMLISRPTHSKRRNKEDALFLGLAAKWWAAIGGVSVVTLLLVVRCATAKAPGSVAGADNASGSLAVTAQATDSGAGSAVTPPPQGGESDEATPAPLRFHVTMGDYADERHAAAKATELQAAGFNAQVVEQDPMHYRAQLGEYGERAAAMSAADHAFKQGYPVNLFNQDWKKLDLSALKFAATPAPHRAPALAPRPAHHQKLWHVQVGNFELEGQATEVANQLGAAGIPARVVEDDFGTFHAEVAGYPDRADALSECDALYARGFTATIR